MITRLAISSKLDTLFTLFLFEKNIFISFFFLITKKNFSLFFFIKWLRIFNFQNILNIKKNYNVLLPNNTTFTKLENQILTKITTRNMIFKNNLINNNAICFFFNKTKNLSFVNLFSKLFFLFNYVSNSSIFTKNTSFKLFSMINSKNNIILFRVDNIFKKWQDSLNLLFNFFFYSITLILFGSFFFKSEIKSFNWSFFISNFHLWKQNYLFFFTKIFSFNSQIDFFFQKLITNKMSTYFITDCNYHFKLLQQLKKKNCYTIGLISNNITPNLISYPIIGFFEILIVQFFFIKNLLLIKKIAVYHKFILNKKYWTNLTLLLMAN